MPLSGAASGRPLMINSVSRRGHRQILLATFSRSNTAFPQLMSPFQAAHRRNLRLDGFPHRWPPTGSGLLKRSHEVLDAFQGGRGLPDRIDLGVEDGQVMN